MKTHDPNGRGGGRTKVRGGGRRSGGRIPHDQAWKPLLRSAIFMESLIRCFVDPEIVAALDLSRLERRSGEHVARGLRTLRGDIVWRAPWRDGSGRLYFPVEIQSRPDPGMPRRMKRYAIHLPQAADPGELPPGRMPPSHPMVIHSGTEAWRAEPSLDAMWSLDGWSRKAAAILEPYQLRRRFRLLSLPDMDAGKLERLDGMAAWLFRLARTKSPAEAVPVARELFRRLGEPQLVGIWDDVMKWIWHVHLPMPASGRPCRNTKQSGSLSPCRRLFTMDGRRSTSPSARRRAAWKRRWKAPSTS